MNDNLVSNETKILHIDNHTNPKALLIYIKENRNLLEDWTLARSMPNNRIDIPINNEVISLTSLVYLDSNKTEFTCIAGNVTYFCIPTDNLADELIGENNGKNNVFLLSGNLSFKPNEPADLYEYSLINGDVVDNIIPFKETENIVTVRGKYSSLITEEECDIIVKKDIYFIIRLLTIKRRSK